MKSNSPTRLGQTSTHPSIIKMTFIVELKTKATPHTIKGNNKNKKILQILSCPNICYKSLRTSKPVRGGSARHPSSPPLNQTLRLHAFSLPLCRSAILSLPHQVPLFWTTPTREDSLSDSLPTKIYKELPHQQFWGPFLFKLTFDRSHSRVWERHHNNMNDLPDVATLK